MVIYVNDGGREPNRTKRKKNQVSKYIFFWRKKGFAKKYNKRERNFFSKGRKEKEGEKNRKKERENSKNSKTKA